MTKEQNKRLNEISAKSDKLLEGYRDHREAVRHRTRLNAAKNATTTRNDYTPEDFGSGDPEMSRTARQESGQVTRASVAVMLAFLAIHNGQPATRSARQEFAIATAPEDGKISTAAERRRARQVAQARSIGFEVKA